MDLVLQKRAYQITLWHKSGCSACKKVERLVQNITESEKDTPDGPPNPKVCRKKTSDVLSPVDYDIALVDIISKEICIICERRTGKLTMAQERK